VRVLIITHDTHASDICPSEKNKSTFTVKVPTDILFRSLWHYISGPLLDLVRYLPILDYSRFWRFRKVFLSSWS
jgi:hypothetical protein